MGAISSIEWTDASWTPIRARNRATGRAGWHCTHVSEACRNCYAEGINKRLGTGLAFKPGHLKDVEIFLDEAMLLAPLRWRKPRKIFVCSMTDLFADFVPDEMIDKVFAVMALAPQHTFQVLTKRPERMLAYLTKPYSLGQFITITDDGRRIDTPAAEVHVRSAMVELLPKAPPHALNAAAAWQDEHCPGDGFLRRWPLPNVWLGTSAEDQPAADARIPDLLATPAAVRFVSYEPALGPINLRSIDISGDEEVLPLGAGWLDRLEEDEVEAPRIDWVICGGESGPHARPMHPDWARSLRDQCATAGVPFFFKQWGEWGPPTDDLGALDWPYHPDHDRTHWFDSRTCARPIEAGWSDKYIGGGGAWPPPPFDMFKTPEFLDQVARCPQQACRETGRCTGNEARAAVVRVGKKAAGRILDGRTHDDLPARAA